MNQVAAGGSTLDYGGGEIAGPFLMAACDAGSLVPVTYQFLHAGRVLRVKAYGGFECRFVLVNEVGPFEERGLRRWRTRAKR